MLVLTIVIVWCVVASLVALAWAAFSAAGRGPEELAEDVWLTPVEDLRGSDEDEPADDDRKADQGGPADSAGPALAA